jgi:hypothetical protein
MEDNGQPRKFFQDGEEWRYDDASPCPIAMRGEVVEDPADLEIIARWQEAYTAKVAAARKLGAIRGAILKHGKRLIREAE